METFVALRKESVDRNANSNMVAERVCVALRKESVDRNVRPVWGVGIAEVALRKESVDRNKSFGTLRRCRHSRSPQGERG